MEQLGSHRKDFHYISYLSIFRKSVEKIKVSLKPEKKNNGYYTWRPLFIFDPVLLDSSQNENISDKSCIENQNTHFMFNNCFSKMVSFMI